MGFPSSHSEERRVSMRPIQITLATCFISHTQRFVRLPPSQCTVHRSFTTWASIMLMVFFLYLQPVCQSSSLSVCSRKKNLNSIDNLCNLIRSLDSVFWWHSIFIFGLELHAFAHFVQLDTSCIMYTAVDSVARSKFVRDFNAKKNISKLFHASISYYLLLARICGQFLSSDTLTGGYWKW